MLLSRTSPVLGVAPVVLALIAFADEGQQPRAWVTMGTNSMELVPEVICFGVRLRSACEGADSVFRRETYTNELIVSDASAELRLVFDPEPRFLRFVRTSGGGDLPRRVYAGAIGNPGRSAYYSGDVLTSWDGVQALWRVSFRGGFRVSVTSPNERAVRAKTHDKG